MKTSVWFLTLPLLWLFWVYILLVFVLMHIAASPVRAVIYWARGIRIRGMTWSGLGDRNNQELEIGVWCHPSPACGCKEVHNDEERT